VLGLDADTTPLVDGEDAGRCEGIVRLSSFTFRLLTPASLSRRFASSRDLLMSGQKPGIFFSSSSEIEKGEPGRKTPLTPLISDTLPRLSEPPQRSMASVKA
jgi:hypothetical protein